MKLKIVFCIICIAIVVMSELAQKQEREEREQIRATPEYKSYYTQCMEKMTLDAYDCNRNALKMAKGEK